MHKYYLLIVLTLPLHAQDTIPPKRNFSAGTVLLLFGAGIGAYVMYKHFKEPSQTPTRATPLGLPGLDDMRFRGTLIQQPITSPQLIQEPQQATAPRPSNPGRQREGMPFAPIIRRPAWSSFQPNNPPSTRRQRSLSQPDIVRATWAATTSTDVGTIDKLLARPDIQQDTFLTSKLTDLKDLVANVEELIKDLNADDPQKAENMTIRNYIETLDRLNKETDDPELKAFIQEQYEILASMHVRIRQYVKTHYRDNSKGQLKPVKYRPRLHESTFKKPEEEKGS